MKEVAVGIALMWLISFITKNKISVVGLGSIIFMLFIAYGLGHIFFTVFGGVL